MRVAIILFLLSLISFSSINVYCLDETVTIPAEDPNGVAIELPPGNYTAEIESGAISLYFPIHPDYCWTFTASIGLNDKGGQEEPTIGQLYVEAEQKMMTQLEAEREALKALKEGREGTQVKFELKEKSMVRFWVNDYDHTDNSGSEKVRVHSTEDIIR